MGGAVGVVAGGTVAGAEDMLVTIVGAVTVVLSVVGVTLLGGIMNMGEGMGVVIVTFVILVLLLPFIIGRGDNVGTMVMVGVSLSIHVIMEDIVVQIRVNHVVVVPVVISTIDIDALVDVQQFKFGNRAVADWLKILLLVVLV